jgi:NAD+ synthase (glutamine-hydrolysing)
VSPTSLGTSDTYPWGVPRLRVALAQLNLVVGDLEGNVARIIDAYERAEADGCDLVTFPELAITGYPPEDLLLRSAFVAQAQESMDKVAARTGRATAVVGFPLLERDLYNAAAVCANGKVHGVYRKHILPNSTVFDEQRYFAASTSDGPLFNVAGTRVAVTICEDAWSPTGPISTQAAGGAELVVNINGSPYYAGRLRERETMLSTRAADASVPIAYVNLVGGQDELVFDGASLVFDEQGRLVARARQFTEDLLVVDLDVRPTFRKRLLDPRGRWSAPALAEVKVSDAHLGERGEAPRVEPSLPPVREVYEALVLGTRDYVAKNGFTDVIFGLSGGIDSSLVAAIAADALGPQRVLGVLMPSRFSSEGSVTDSEAVASNLGIRTLTIPIEAAHTAFLELLAEPFRGTEPGLAEENLQARIRGTVLMSLSNKFGALVLTTGNKSELATGYATLYGDMAGGFAVIKDVPKMLVYALARDRNERAGRDLVPEAVLDKPPSAELRPDQRDSDSLPDYSLLDPILEGYVEGDLSVSELEEAGFDPDVVRSVARRVDRNEYKRRQAPPGVRVSPKAFGKDRRLPITNRWPG